MTLDYEKVANEIAKYERQKRISLRCSSLYCAFWLITAAALTVTTYATWDAVWGCFAVITHVIAGNAVNQFYRIKQGIVK